MFFSKPYEYTPCGVFNIKHFCIALVTFLLIGFTLKFTMNRNEKQVHKIIVFCTIVIWILEILKIAFNISIGFANNVNEYLPLYYCSVLLYAGLMSSFGRGKLKRAGDVCLATGGLIGGIVFILYPSTSLPQYPLFHFLSLHSFLFHGTMVYLGLLVNFSHYIEIHLKDIWYFAIVMGILCMVALVVNNLFNGNLMFISHDFPGTPISILYHHTGMFFTPIMIIIQMFLPFLVVYGILKLSNKKLKTT